MDIPSNKLLPNQDIRQLLTIANGHYQASRLAAAEGAYRDVLALAPDHANTQYNLAVVLKAQGKLDEAIAQYERTLIVKPDSAKAHNNLGIILAGRGRLDEAAAHYEKALAINPDYANAHYNLANILKDRNRLDEAAAHLGRAVAIQPGDAEAHNNLGIVLQELGRPGEAAAHYERAIALRADYAEARNNLGTALKDLGRPDEATACYEKALALKPDYADAHYNLGHILSEQDKIDEAVPRYELAVAIDPGHAKAHNNLGFVLQQQGRLDEAAVRYQRAQTLEPDYADAHWNESLLRLLRGDFPMGWQKYEWRWRRKETPPRVFAEPLWKGGDLAGQTILLHAEQGFGDAMQFIRYAPLVKKRAARLVVECQPELLRLFAGVSGMDQLVARGGVLPPFDCHAPLLSLPGLLGTSLETIPTDGPYLRAEPDLVQAWREKLARRSGLNVGLVWRGNPNHSNDRKRSIAVEAMAALCAVADVNWVSLQADPRPDEMEFLSRTGIEDSARSLGDWADTAALVSALDLVMTVDTGVAHLAGALGKPVWVLLPFAPDWRWLLDRDDSPWYPSLRLYRQHNPGDWSPVLSRVTQELERSVRADRSAEGTTRASKSGLQVKVASHQRSAAMVVSHERSGTHFLMNSLAYCYGYTSSPWIDLDSHNININYFLPSEISKALDSYVADPLSRIVKSHHSADFFADQLPRIIENHVIFYIYRDPVAVMLSLWRHLNRLAWVEGPKVASPLTLARTEPCGQMMRYQMRQYPNMLRRWAAHVEGWLDAAKTTERLIGVRYEDLDAHYEQTVSSFSRILGRKPQTPMLCPPRDFNVISGGADEPTGSVVPLVLDELRAFCRAEVGETMARLGY